MPHRRNPRHQQPGDLAAPYQSYASQHMPPSVSWGHDGPPVFLKDAIAKGLTEFNGQPLTAQMIAAAGVDGLNGAMHGPHDPKMPRPALPPGSLGPTSVARMPTPSPFNFG